MTAKRLIIAAAAGIAAAAALSACNSDVFQSTSETHHYQVDAQVTQLVLKDDAGRVEITTGDGPITVTETYRYSRTAPKTSHDITDGALRLTDDSCGGQHHGRCEIDYSIRVPAATGVEISADAGRVDVTGLAGDLKITADAGQVQATGLASAHTVVEANAGKISLAYRQAPASVRARADAGAVSIILPKSDSYAVDASTDAGKVTVEVAQDSGSAHTITAHSDAGKVEVVNG